MNFLAWMNPGRWLLMLAGIAALTLGYFAWADHIGNEREAKVVARYAKQAVAADTKRDAITADLVPKAAAAQEKIRTVFKTITKEVTVYVKATDCPMPGGFRVYHDAAANGTLPDPAAVADAAPAPAKVVASTVAENYGTYYEVAQRLTSLQEWVKAQQAVGPAK
jgi:hypothetical protein